LWLIVDFGATRELQKIILKKLWVGGKILQKGFCHVAKVPIIYKKN
jgi:hypothetical protein